MMVFFNMIVDTNYNYSSQAAGEKPVGMRFRMRHEEPKAEGNIEGRRIKTA